MHWGGGKGRAHRLRSRKFDPFRTQRCHPPAAAVAREGQPLGLPAAATGQSQRKTEARGAGGGRGGSGGARRRSGGAARAGRAAMGARVPGPWRAAPDRGKRGGSAPPTPLGRRERAPPLLQGSVPPAPSAAFNSGWGPPYQAARALVEGYCPWQLGWGGDLHRALSEILFS